MFLVQTMQTLVLEVIVNLVVQDPMEILFRPVPEVRYSMPTWVLVVLPGTTSAAGQCWEHNLVPNLCAIAHFVVILIVARNILLCHFVLHGTS